TIDLDPLVTLGGTTQLAIDNFIINDGTPAAPSREPVYYNASHPVPDTTIYRFMYVDAEASEENQTNIAPEDLFGADLASVSVQTSNPDATQPLSAEAF